jgi:sterol desaturase/sphingolipid hydroxylase (fatty acid hydroxylase superfamily)
VFVIYLILSTAHAQFEHANIRLPTAIDRLLRRIVVTPDMHKVHHSRVQIETDSNYGNILSLWDKVFHTYTPKTDFQTLRFGLDGFDDKRHQTFTALLKVPFESGV